MQDRCLECGKPFSGERFHNGQYNPKANYSQGLHKRCYEKRRRQELGIGRRWERHYEEQYGQPAECYWCTGDPDPEKPEKDVDPAFKAEGSKAVVGWFMDEGICAKHLDLAEKWARHLLRSA